MALQSIFYEVPKGWVELISLAAKGVNIRVSEDSSGLEFISEKTRGVFVGVEFEGDSKDFICLVAVDVSLESGKLFSEINEIILSCSGVELAANEIPSSSA